MHLLTAAGPAHHQPDDFSATVPGELVYLGPVCDRDLTNSDQGCGCGRAFAGFSSNRYTTVALVADVDVTPDDLTSIVRGAAPSWSWDDTDIAGVVDDLRELGATWPVGTLVQRHLDDVDARP